jgi:isopentenyl-diphosphate delta-isomerase
MPDPLSTSSRKTEHIRINLEEDVSSLLTTGLENYRFIHQALPELDLNAVDMTAQLFGKKVRIPVLISSMTGGAADAARINRHLALAAQELGMAMGLGSQRAAIERGDLADTFQVRAYAPDILLFANLGAVQLNYRYGVEQCRQAVDMIAADGLILHLNPLQEALQPEGDTNFSGLLHKIEAVCRTIGVPVVVKEVGWGISAQTARELASAGVSAIDVAGAGGTSWSQVEMYRNPDPILAKVAASFRNWGIQTAEALTQVVRSVPGLPVIASGGLKDGIDIAKCLALGASLGGMAGPFLHAAAISPEETVQFARMVASQIRICMFASGSSDLKTLREHGLHPHPPFESIRELK